MLIFLRLKYLLLGFSLPVGDMTTGIFSFEPHATITEALVVYINFQNMMLGRECSVIPGRRGYSPIFFGTRSLTDWLGQCRPSHLSQLAAAENFSKDRLGYQAISMNFKTESFPYVILLIFTHFVISLTFNFMMIG